MEEEKEFPEVKEEVKNKEVKKKLKEEKKVSKVQANVKESKGEKKTVRESKILKKLRENPWIVSTIVLGILVLVFLFSSFVMSGNVISEEEIGDLLLSFYESNGVSGLSVDSISEVSGVYVVNFLYEGNTVPIYATKDGKFVGSLSALPDTEETETEKTPSTTTPTQDVPKSDKPLVELFVMSHCPYGTQAEKGMIPVIKALGNSVNFKLRFVYYAMHPTYGEVEEQLNQYCIQEEQNDKFLSYLECFLTAGDGKGCLTTAGIDQTKLTACTKKVDAEYSVLANLNDKSTWLSGSYPMFNINKDLNTQYSIRGSPTLVVNGKTVDSARDAASYLSVVCQAFNDAPDACGSSLSSTAPSAGFGWGASGSTNAATCG